MSRDEVREGVVAGSRVRCRSRLAACLDELDHLCLGRDGAAAGLGIDYELEPTPDGRFALVRDGLTFAVTDHAENLVTLLQKDVRSALERRAAERGLWLHAAGLVHPAVGGLLLAGASSAGKSTAALLLCRRGFRLVADDVVWLSPARGFRGLGWAIGLEALPLDPALLGAEGFTLRRQAWCEDAEERTERWRVRPPASAIADAAAWQPLAGIAVLERGPSEVRPLTAGELLVRLWPLRIARVDGEEPWAPAALASALGGVPSVVVRSESPDAACAALARWAEGLPSTPGRGP